MKNEAKKKKKKEKKKEKERRKKTKENAYFIFYINLFFKQGKKSCNFRRLTKQKISDDRGGGGQSVRKCEMGGVSKFSKNALSDI